MLKRRVVLFKEIAQMVLNRSEAREIMPWLNILSAETTYDYSLFWNMSVLPDGADKLWQDMHPDIMREIERICISVDKYLSSLYPGEVFDCDVLDFAELCSELGHLSVWLNVPQLDNQLADMAGQWIPLFVSPENHLSQRALSILLASVMQFKGMGMVELKEDDSTNIHLN